VNERRDKRREGKETPVDQIVTGVGNVVGKVGERVEGLRASVSDARARRAAREEVPAEIASAVGERVRGAMEGLRSSLETAAKSTDRLDDAVNWLGDKIASVHADMGGALERIEAVEEAVAAHASQTAEEIASLNERLDRIEASLDQIAGGASAGEEERRRLVLDVVRAMKGHVCEECGFVAQTAGGLASHQRSHA
jgi:chromosome segregation ATPase